MSVAALWISPQPLPLPSLKGTRGVCDGTLDSPQPLLVPSLEGTRGVCDGTGFSASQCLSRPLRGRERPVTALDLHPAMAGAVPRAYERGLLQHSGFSPRRFASLSLPGTVVPGSFR